MAALVDSPSPRSVKVFKATDMVTMEGTSQSKIKDVASPESNVVAGVATAGAAAFNGNPDNLACGNNNWTVTTCKRNLHFQQAREAAFEAVFEQVVENAAKEYTEWIIGSKPQTAGYKRMRKFLKSDPKVAEAFLKLVFPHTNLTLHEQAVQVDHIFESRNKNQHASTFAALDRLMGRAARIIMASTSLRQVLPDCCILIDKYYEGGRQMVIESNATAFREVFGCDMKEDDESPESEVPMVDDDEMAESEMPMDPQI